MGQISGSSTRLSLILLSDTPGARHLVVKRVQDGLTKRSLGF